jgi:CTP:molybdopterin cytidylyltransferase MocA
MIDPSDITAIILAAGESRRMGTPKPLLLLGKDTLLEKSVNLFTKAGITDIQVVTGRLSDTLRRRLPDLPVGWVPNDGFRQGMFSSVKKGVSAVNRHRTWFFLLPVDIPLVRPETLMSMLKACPAATGSNTSVLHPAFMGHRGHPPLISTRLIPDILSWEGGGGLGGFLARNRHDVEDIPVFDEYILRDMDTPDDYRALAADLCRNHLPTPAECEAILGDASFFESETAAHCRRVAEVAVHIGQTLAASNVPLDIRRIEAAALLHDISKGEKNHAAAGARKLSDMGFSGIADIVSTHMDISVSGAASPTEAEVVYLADKLVRGDALVPLDVRFRHKLAKYGHDPSARIAIQKRRANAEAILDRMEQSVGKSFPEIMAGFPEDIK